ncbi:cytosine deaminase [Paucilactobacillus vaccinostercus DSM 20634]|jgi:cytosine deaminase|uniref:Cytosine deaminase n=1 Tax=Paucilactobacillus vaccinostercus DSM 20634 TaxID=1423813 RepID=A0A0R2A4S7_9LACO|nr:cytosine deaminase [Paucilactobacillus vaccinostercus]KRM62048.1 cytosine deaminase [Paucilactobacillus vaccinostercus DSM 20634]RRG10827.1 MAG: cytosine deaminase [Lactobacillus sp.]
MLIKNVHIESNDQVQDIRIEDGRFVAIEETIDARDGERVIDGAGKLLLPPLIDSHVHLDATRTAGQPEWNETGTLFDGIRIWSERRKTLTKADVKQRAKATIREQVANGIQIVRSHVDVTDPNLTALEALLEVRDEVKDVVDLQLVAFPQSGILSFPHGKELMEQAVKMGVDVIGGIPHYEFTRDYGVDSLKFIVGLAEKYDRLIDVHCDEIDDPNSRNLEVLATLAYETGLGDHVTASHTTAMGSYDDAYCYKLFRLLQMANVNFVCNPEVNLHLGGRFDTYPKRRSMTRIKELSEAGINVSFGEDDIKDPWYPMGNGNMLDQVQIGILAGQLMGYTQIQNAYQFVTNNAAKTLHISDHYGIAVGKPANCILLNQTNFYDALNEHAEVLYSIRQGRVLVETQPKQVKLNF